MRKIILVLILILGMMGSLSVLAQGAEEELKGKVILEKLEAKEAICENLTDADFEALGEYFMGQMLAPSGTEGKGTSHEAMNTMMAQMMGKEGEEQMHLAMGKRMSNCEPNAPLPQNMMKSAAMPAMMGSEMMGGNNWGFGAGWGWFGGLFLFSVWILIVVAIFALIKWLIKKPK